VKRVPKRAPKRKPKPKPKPKPRRRVVLYWKCTDLGKNQLGIECPGCGNKTVVNKTVWIARDRTYTSRGCTYCDWFFTIPLDMLPARDPRREDYS
jgi:hypothetical protein